jgi:hypothetical protein
MSASPAYPAPAPPDGRGTELERPVDVKSHDFGSPTAGWRVAIRSRDPRRTTRFEGRPDRCITIQGAQARTNDHDAVSPNDN